MVPGTVLQLLAVTYVRPKTLKVNTDIGQKVCAGHVTEDSLLTIDFIMTNGISRIMVKMSLDIKTRSSINK
jgi:hypothetical protein